MNGQVVAMSNGQQLGMVDGSPLSQRVEFCRIVPTNDCQLMRFGLLWQVVEMSNGQQLEMFPVAARGPASRHGCLHSLFQVALHLPSSDR